MKSPILFTIFKREDTTRRVFERIREARPPRLYIAADGPRVDVAGEAGKCAATRRVVENIDWPCEVKRLYRKENLGCGLGMSSAITWFFENEPEGIIIEDDILPHPDFFRYCDEMLERYREDNRIQSIAGWNRFYDSYDSNVTYFMSATFQVWGWATWRRVWKTYEFDVAKLPVKLIQRIIEKNVEFMDINDIIIKKMVNHEIDTWDYQFYMNQILYGRYSIMPYTNMIENIGFDSVDATHTVGANKLISNHKSASPYPIKHPYVLSTDRYADYITYINGAHLPLSFRMRVVGKIKRVIRLIGKIFFLSIVSKT